MRGSRTTLLLQILRLVTRSTQPRWFEQRIGSSVLYWAGSPLLFQVLLCLSRRCQRSQTSTLDRTPLLCLPLYVREGKQKGFILWKGAFRSAVLQGSYSEHIQRNQIYDEDNRCIIQRTQKYSISFLSFKVKYGPKSIKMKSASSPNRGEKKINCGTVFTRISSYNRTNLRLEYYSKTQKYSISFKELKKFLFVLVL